MYIVIFGSEEDGIHFFRKDSVGTSAYRANISTGHQLWRYAPPGCKPVEAAPAVSNGKMVVGSFDGCLYGFWDGTEVTAPLVLDTGIVKIAGNRTAAMGTWTLTLFPNPASGGIRPCHPSRILKYTLPTFGRIHRSAPTFCEQCTFLQYRPKSNRSQFIEEIRQGCYCDASGVWKVSLCDSV